MPNADRSGRRARRSAPRDGAVAASLAVVGLVALTASLAGCVGADVRSPLPSTPPGTPAAPPTSTASPTPSGPPPVLLPSGGVEVVAEGLDAPWSILRLPDGGVLVSERDTADIVEVLADGSLRVAATVPGVVPGGEGGLLFGGVNAGYLGEEVSLREAFLAGVGGSFAPGEQGEMFLRSRAKEAFGGQAEEAFLGADDGGEGFVVTGVFAQVNNLGKKLPQLLDKAEDVVALL